MVKHYDLAQFGGPGCLVYANHQVYPTGADHPRHGHGGVEILHVLRGTGRHHTEAVSHPLVAGDLCVIDRGAEHAFVADPGLAFDCLMFAPEVLGPADVAELSVLPGWALLAPTARPGARTVVLPPTPRRAVAAGLAMLVRECAAAAPGWRIAARGQLLDLLVRIARSGSNAAEPVAHDAIDRALSLLHADTVRPWSVAGLARRSGLSAGHFGACFQARTGTTLHDYLQRLRIENVRHQLEASDQPIARIAAACGFADAGYCARLFRKLTGQSPSAYRRQHAVRPTVSVPRDGAGQ